MDELDRVAVGVVKRREIWEQWRRRGGEREREKRVEKYAHQRTRFAKML